MQDRKYGYASTQTYTAFINENIFPNRYLFSNIRVVVTRGLAIIKRKKKKKDILDSTTKHPLSLMMMMHNGLLSHRKAATFLCSTQNPFILRKEIAT